MKRFLVICDDVWHPAEDADVFLTSHSETRGVHVAGYTREMGRGRLCVLTPGHTLSVWQNREFQKIFRNAMQWCLKVME